MQREREREREREEGEGARGTEKRGERSRPGAENRPSAATDLPSAGSVVLQTQGRKETQAGPQRRRRKKKREGRRERPNKNGEPESGEKILPGTGKNPNKTMQRITRNIATSKGGARAQKPSKKQSVAKKNSRTNAKKGRTFVSPLSGSENNGISGYKTILPATPESHTEVRPRRTTPQKTRSAKKTSFPGEKRHKHSQNRSKTVAKHLSPKHELTGNPRKN